MEAKTASKRQKKTYITVLSVLAGFAVVALHVNSFWTFRKSWGWVVTDFVESLFYFAVPVFFMITGATLIDYRKRYTTKEFLKKRIKRTVIPFLIWSIIGIIFYQAKGGAWTGVRDAISGVFTCRYVSIYWFFPALFAVYLLIPFVSLIPENKRKEAFKYAIGACLIVNIALPFVLKLLGIQHNADFMFPLGGYAIYILMGYWIDNYPIPLRWRKGIYICGLAGFLVHFFGTWILSFQAGEIVELFKDYLSLPCVVYSAAIFLWFKNLKDEKVLNKLGRVAKPLAPLAYGIYLVQWFVLQMIAMSGWVNVNSVFYTFWGTIMVYGICAGIVYVLSKIPLLRNIV